MTFFFTSMSISVDSPSGETLNRGPVALILLRQYPFGINTVQFSISFFSTSPYVFNIHSGKVRVRCNEKRVESHQFYKAIGFSSEKVQRVFEARSYQNAQEGPV